MKRILSLLLVVLLTFSLVACGNKDTTTEDLGVVESYQKLSYNDFNNLAMEKGFSPVENTDNSSVKFTRSFSISDDTGFNVIFYELENTSIAYTYYNYVLQTYESYTSEFSASQKFNDYGCYMMKDANVTLYIAFVENTMMYSLVSAEDAKESATNRNKLTEFVEFVQYPILDFPEFKN